MRLTDSIQRTGRELKERLFDEGELLNSHLHKSPERENVDDILNFFFAVAIKNGPQFLAVKREGVA